MMGVVEVLMSWFLLVLLQLGSVVWSLFILLPLIIGLLEPLGEVILFANIIGVCGVVCVTKGAPSLPICGRSSGQPRRKREWENTWATASWVPCAVSTLSVFNFENPK